jgi:hypothetical protein
VEQILNSTRVGTDEQKNKIHSDDLFKPQTPFTAQIRHESVSTAKKKFHSLTKKVSRRMSSYKLVLVGLGGVGKRFQFSSHFDFSDLIF